MEAKIAKGEIVHVDASLIRADASWDSLAVRHVEGVNAANGEAEAAARKSQDGQVQEDLRNRPGCYHGDKRPQSPT